MKNLYMCDICGEVFENEIDAKQCESNHRTPTDAIPYEYAKKSQFPYKLKVMFGNKVYGIYRYESGLWGM